MPRNLSISAAQKWLQDHPVKATSVSGFILQMSRPLSALISLPLIFNALSESAFGVWLISLSLIGLVGIVSVGISSSIVTQVSRIDKHEEIEQISAVTTASFILSATCAGILIIILSSLIFFIDLSYLYDLSESGIEGETRSLLFALTILFSLTIVAVIPKQIMFGRLQGYLSHTLEICGVIISLIGIFVAIHFHPRMWVMAVFFVAPSSAFLLFGGLIYLSRLKIKYFNWREIDWPLFHQLRKDAVRMSWYHVAFTISSQSDMILIGAILGPAATVDFGVAHRVFSPLVMASLVLNHAQWPALARAEASGNQAALMPLFRRTLTLVPLGTGLLAACLVLLYNPLVALWLGEKLETDPLILWGMVAWVCVATVANTCDSLLRARNKAVFLMRTMGVMAVLNLALTLVLLPLIGAAGAIWGSAVAYLVALVFPYLWYLRADIWERAALQK